MFPYEESIERKMKHFYDTLSEKDKRRYSAIESIKIGHGGITYIAGILLCDRNTISQGIKELEHSGGIINLDRRIRQSGGGRKPYYEVNEGLDEKFLDILKDYTAGDPMNENVVWTDLTQQEIIDRIDEEYKILVSPTVIGKLLKKHNYRRRKAQKKKTMKTVKNRNEQFENISTLKRSYQEAGLPIISIDTKKKEMLGNFYRDGVLYTKEVVETFDHDFNSFADGIIIPHGIYDLGQNFGYITLGTSKETSEFICDCIRNWWYDEAQYEYPFAPCILMLCDSGGANSCRHYLFKEDLQKLVDQICVKIRVAHYPPYTSKYNPIEHRLFPHITRACQGVILKSVDTVKTLMEKTRTKTGLRTTVRTIEKTYKTGRKVAQDFKENMKIAFDDFLPQWNYTVIPT